MAEEEERQIVPHEPDSDDFDDGDDQFPIPKEMLDSLPPEQRSVFRSALSMSMGIFRPPTDPIRRRITSEHITQILENQEKSDQRYHSSENSDRWLLAWFGTMGVLATIGLTLFFGIREQYDIIAAIVTGVLGFAGGSELAGCAANPTVPLVQFPATPA